MDIKIENFEGPFDLLLHLIKKNKMSIYNINIYDITIQYIDYINEMKELDLDIASEFIVMAATLIEMKSRHLVPQKLNKVNEEENEEVSTDLLFDRLIEYKKFKRVSEILLSRYQDKGNAYFKKPEIIDQPKDEVVDLNQIFKDIDILYFYEKYKKLINSYIEKQNNINPIQNNIYLDKFRVEDKIRDLKNTSGVVLRFNEIIKPCIDKVEIIIIFIAILELVKQNYFKIIQVGKFTDIILEKNSMEYGEYEDE
ncbi:Segregation and condensation protein A [Candidatus Arthromitus sp. SFB-mouse-Japan]|uniref:segregation and condensation protein A n=1 Tax=Candidatus Arthromitus sp. SFB-mouse TaxID=49118 RepID=UPI00021B7F2D|nr:segregation/condensation protein A [Candidatus Arthromitus sp. SFB-mouse]EIA22589.1 Segregation and condensation protein A [Candidatus Arthromitus sp. SFB-2]EIA24069.1 Segregation and condensation protein A [Candidatus Arthromitus sp. SFB-1]EIA25345.1 Segregation and condensation protein A [Candidatus Arthromitus sp. SFB-4]EIA28338.1 Segregation and condensation protein A [Candidatus Arthromitus sp. SFB-co]EIA29914.1 Segregation and condensation protein A [Candidatus Arthromitus sp. SFB-mou